MAHQIQTHQLPVHDHYSATFPTSFSRIKVDSCLLTINFILERTRQQAKATGAFDVSPPTSFNTIQGRIQIWSSTKLWNQQTMNPAGETAFFIYKREQPFASLDKGNPSSSASSSLSIAIAPPSTKPSNCERSSGSLIGSSGIAASIDSSCQRIPIFR